MKPIEKCKKGEQIVSYFRKELAQSRRDAKLRMAEFQFHCLLMDSSTFIFWTSLFVILGVSGLFCRFYSILMEILLINNVGPDQTSDATSCDV